MVKNVDFRILYVNVFVQIIIIIETVCFTYKILKIVFNVALGVVSELAITG